MTSFFMSSKPSRLLIVPVQVSEIVDVRRGWKTDTFNKFGNKVVGEQRKMKNSVKRRLGGEDNDGVVKPLVDEACCFSVVYGDSRSSLDLVADSPQVRETTANTECIVMHSENTKFPQLPSMIFANSGVVW